MLFPSQQKTFAKRTLCLILITLMSLPAWTADYITDVTVIGFNVNSFQMVIKKYLQWKSFSVNLNEGCSSSMIINLLYKTSRSNDSEVITDFLLRQGNNPPDSLTYQGRTYHLTPYDGSYTFTNSKGDLNNGAGGDYIYLYYTKDDFPDGRAVDGITFNSIKDGAVGDYGGTEGYDLNEGTEGSKIYMHLSTMKVPTTGSGTEADPYVIHNLGGWNDLAVNVSNGNSYSGEYFKLGKNISGITTVVGNTTYPFSGHFDGNGKTLNVNTTDPPFLYINEATIQNLTVTGCVSSNRTWSSGLVGILEGEANTIQDCIVKATVSGPTNVGGFVGASAGGTTDSVTIRNCIFDGTLETGNADGFAGGLIGWCNTIAFNVSDCLIKGTYSGTGHMHSVDCRQPEDQTRGYVSDTYYLNTIDLTDFPDDHTVSKTEGIAVSNTMVDELWNIPVTATDGRTYYRSGSATIVDEPVKLPEEAVVQSGWAIISNFYMSMTTLDYDRYIEVAFHNNDIYIKGLSLFFPDSWLKGKLNGNTAVFANGQFMGENESGKHYMTGFDGHNFTDIEFSYNDIANTLTLTTYRLFDSPERNSLLVWGYFLNLMVSGPQTDQLIQVPEGVEIETDWVIDGNYILESSANFGINQATEVAFDGNDVYIKGLSYFHPEAWVKGTLTDNKLSLYYGQYLGETNGKKTYLIGLDNGAIVDIVFNYDRNDKTLSLTTPYILENDNPKLFSNIRGYYDGLKVYKGMLKTILPQGIETQEYMCSGRSVHLFDGSPRYFNFYFETYKIGFDGNDVYIQGLSYEIPDAWAKGTLDGNTITFPKGQFLGHDEYNHSHYLLGMKDSELCDVTFSYDDQAKTLTSNTWVVDNRNKYSVNSFYDYSYIHADNSVWEPFKEPEATPVNPTVVSEECQFVWMEAFKLIGIVLDVPYYDIDGNKINPNKLYYRIYEDCNNQIQHVENILNAFTTGLNDSYETPILGSNHYSYMSGNRLTFYYPILDDIDRVGVQLIYYGGLEEGESGHTSDIVWYNIQESDKVDYTNAPDISYIKADGTTGIHKAIPISTTQGATTLASGWYVIDRDVDYTEMVVFEGDANIILADGCTMTVGTAGNPITSEYGIAGGSLKIYGQSGGTGQLITAGTDAGIICSYITINGGNVTATAYKNNGIYIYGNININGGNITANNSILTLFGNINLAGGTVTATNITAQRGLVKLAGNTSLNTLNIPTDVTVNSISLDRTFTAGKTATLMLPLSMSVSDISGGSFYTFGGVKKDNGQWVAIMNQLTDSLTANTPYLVMPTETSLTFNVSDNGVTLNTTGGGNGQTADPGSHWTFKGTYDYMKWTTDTEDPDYSTERADEIGKVYGFAGVANPENSIDVGDFVKVANGARIRPMSAYLMWNDTKNAVPLRGINLSGAAQELPNRIMVRLVGIDGTLTGIGTLDTQTGQISFDADGWYTLDGIRLEGEPIKSGIYINNGKKIVIE